MHSIVSTVLTVLTVLTVPAAGQSMAGRAAIYAPHGVVAAPQPLAAQAGLRVLQQGGNAIDAAVTAAIMLGLVEPMMSGIGGDLFVIMWSAKEQKLVGLNASGRAGSLMTIEELRRRGQDRMPIYGPLTVTVPGALSGWVALLEHYGTISLAQALEPTIQLAEDGFPVSPAVAKEWDVLGTRLREDPGGKATFFSADGKAPAAGEWFTNRDLAADIKSGRFRDDLGVLQLAHAFEQATEYWKTRPEIAG